MAKITKAIIAFVGGLGTWGVTAFADDSITSVELFGLCGVVVSALLVFQIPNADTINVKRDDSGKFVSNDSE